MDELESIECEIAKLSHRREELDFIAHEMCKLSRRKKELDFIAHEMCKLSRRKKELEDQEQSDNQEFLSSMQWAKGAKCSFVQNSFGPYGHTEYVLKFHFTKLQERQLRANGAYNGAFLRGDSLLDQNNLFLELDEWGYSVKTCNTELFIEIIEKIKPVIEKSDWFDDNFKVMKAVEKRMICL